MMISSNFVKTFSVIASILLVAACASNPEPAQRTEQTSQQVGDTFDAASTVRVGDVDRQTATNSSSAGNSSGSASSSSFNSNSTSANSAPSSADLDGIVYFGFDQSALKPETRNLLAKHAAALIGSTEVVRLEGHADELGTREYNMALGERRAKAVMNYLSSLGVPRSRMNPVSYGEEKPVVLGSGESARVMNRRVEIVYN